MYMLISIQLFLERCNFFIFLQTESQSLLYLRPYESLVQFLNYLKYIFCHQSILFD